MLILTEGSNRINENLIGNFHIVVEADMTISDPITEEEMDKLKQIVGEALGGTQVIELTLIDYDHTEIKND